MHYFKAWALGAHRVETKKVEARKKYGKERYRLSVIIKNEATRKFASDKDPEKEFFTEKAATRHEFEIVLHELTRAYTRGNVEPGEMTTPASFDLFVLANKDELLELLKKY